MPRLQENDILCAYKALNIAPGLSDTARRVAGAIIDHFNRRTGQCDPNIDRLVRMLEVNRATSFGQQTTCAAMNVLRRSVEPTAQCCHSRLTYVLCRGAQNLPLDGLDAK